MMVNKALHNTRFSKLLKCDRCGETAVDHFCGETLCRDCMCPDYKPTYNPERQSLKPGPEAEKLFSPAKFNREVTEAMIRVGISEGVFAGKGAATG